MPCSIALAVADPIVERRHQSTRAAETVDWSATADGGTAARVVRRVTETPGASSTAASRPEIGVVGDERVERRLTRERPRRTSSPDHRVGLRKGIPRATSHSARSVAAA